MHRMECLNCRHYFVHMPMVECPDGRAGCLVAHFGDAQWVCTACGHDNKAGHDAAWLKYKAANPSALTWPVREGVGICAYNPTGLKRLEMTR